MNSHGASPSLARLAAAYRYLYYSDRIEGWLYQTTALAMMEFIWLQEEAGLAGDLAEIGVHHGCSALALVAAARPDETLIAIDLFDRQDLNVDASGLGSLAAFQAHLQYLFPAAQVCTVAKSSVDIRGAEIEHGLSDLRFFSVDGGHTRALTLNDLQIADASLAPHGIAVLDDVFNVSWPGVASGLFAFLGRGSDLAPFAIFPNKVFLCRRAFAERYRGGCRKFLGYALHKTGLELQDHDVDVYEDRWPHLTPRLADPKVAAAAEADIRAIEDRGSPIRRPMIAHPGDMAHASSQLADAQNLLVRERRRTDVLENRLEQAGRKAEQVAASTSWRVTAPLRWLGAALSRARR